MSEEITILKRYFAASHIPLCTIWLNDCIKWCKEESLGPNYTIEDLKFKVFEQWTLLDLRDVEIKQLPPLLSGKKKFTLNGHYSLQVVKVTDISKPKYWQLQRIRNETPKNLEKDETASSSRVLLVTLTDGVQEVEAMEYRPISVLNLNITPGVKVKIIGPVEVRRGRLMLEERNIKIVGGEVDSLIVPNAAENVLARSLNLPLNPNPRGVQESILNQENDVTLTMSTYTQPQNQTVRNVTNVQNQNVHIQNPRNRNINQSISISSNAQTQNQPNQPNFANTPAEELWREEMRIDQEIDELLEVERELETGSVNPKADITSDMFEDDFQMENVKIPDTNDDLIKSLESENDIFENMDIDAHLDQIDQQINERTDSIRPIRTILKDKLKGKFKIRAKFTTVFEKLKIINDKFHLIIEVEDDSGSLILKVQNEIVEILANCTVERFISLQNSLQNGGSTAKLIEVLAPLKEHLQNIEGTMEIEIKSEERYPCLIKLN